MMGIPRGESPETCTAGAGTLILEFGLLSRLTGNPVYMVQLLVIFILYRFALSSQFLPFLLIFFLSECG